MIRNSSGGKLLIAASISSTRSIPGVYHHLPAPFTLLGRARARLPAATINSQLKHPLLGPLAAIAAGILVSRFVPFPQFELLAAIAAFLALGILALYRHARALAVA